MNKFSFFLCLFFVCSFAIGQNTRSAEKPTVPKPQYQAVKKEKSGFFSFLKKGNSSSSKKTEVEQFRSRLKKVYREKAKEEKLSEKKRYKDHGYFGHKRPPKKRPPDKMKYCKVCQLKH